MKFENISKTIVYSNGAKSKLLDDISFSVNDGKITSLLASSGSGKSTLLKILCGLELPDSGIRIEKSAALIPSEPSSFPWMNASESILFANEKVDEAAQKRIINLVGLEGYESHFPNNKSLGFRFRIALARALASAVKIILIDEPFTKMDQRTRMEMLQLIVDINEETKTTVLFATSNLSEAALISHSVLLMKKGITGTLQDFNFAYTNSKLNERSSSSEYTEQLGKIENNIRSLTTQQSFTISL